MTAAELRAELAAMVVTDVRQTKRGELEILFAGERDGEPLAKALVIGSEVTLEVGRA